MSRKIGVIGAGAWGTALAQSAARARHDVVLWGRNGAQMAAMAETGENAAYLPGVKLSARISPTADFTRLAGADIILLVTPAQTTADMARTLSGILGKPTPVVLCSKGILRSTMQFLSQVLVEACPKAIPVVLSGPSFAHDVVRGLPTAVTLACEDGDLAAELGETLSSHTFRLYHSSDIVGAQVGGAVKNVLAIACGIVMGRKLGASAHAALTARGFAELSRLGMALGAELETLSGLAGLGDLILTCGSPQSRNMALGIRLGEAEDSRAVLAGETKLAEGALTAAPLVGLARARGIDMPISQGVAAIIDGQIDVTRAIDALLSRPLKAEGI